MEKSVSEKSPLLGSGEPSKSSPEAPGDITPAVLESNHNNTPTTSSTPPPPTSYDTEDEVDGGLVVNFSPAHHHHPTMETDTALHDGPHPNTPIRTYTTRFWILFVFSALACFQCVQWNTWGPLNDSVNAAFHGWGSMTVAMMANWGTIMFVTTVVPMCWLMTSKGIRVGVLTCTGLLALGTVLRVIPFFTSSDTFFTVMAHVCAICVGIPGTLVMAAPPMIAAVWFPPKERTTATAVSQAFNILGSAVSYMEPLVVRAPSEGATPEQIKGDIKRLLYIWAGVGVSIFVCALVYFPDKPPTPPSLTSHFQKPHFMAGIKQLMKNREAVLVTLSYGLTTGVPAAWTSVLNYSLSDLGLNQVESMWVGLSAVIVSGVAALMVGRFTDLVYGHVKLSLIVCIIGNIICYYWFYLLTWGGITITKWQIYATVIGGLSLNFACCPLFFELAVEVAHPCPEVIVAGMATGINNLIGLLFLFVFFIPNIGYSWVTYLLLGMSSVAILPLLFVQEEYSRSNIDRHHHQRQQQQHHSAYQAI